MVMGIVPTEENSKNNAWTGEQNHQYLLAKKRIIRTLTCITNVRRTVQLVSSLIVREARDRDSTDKEHVLQHRKKVKTQTIF